jgi:hypothetical protein
MAFYLSIKKNGVDLYPRLFDAMDNPDTYETNKVRFELMKRLGYFVTESSEHHAEYSSFFIPHGAKTIEEFDIPIDEYLRRCESILDEFERMRVFSKNNEPIDFQKSSEYGSTIIHSIVTGKPSVVYGNMPNNGAISNLPANAIVEVPTLVNSAGLQPTTVGDLPTQLLAYMAALTGKRDPIYQAAMFDPLTAATLTTDKIVELCDELIAAHGVSLPKLDATSRVRTSGKIFRAVYPYDLRASWDAVQDQKTEDNIKSWQIIGPIASATRDTISLSQATDIENAFIANNGAIDILNTYKSGPRLLQWKSSSADKSGYINLNGDLSGAEYSIAYAYAEIESAHVRDTILSCGSDDGIKIWLNGKIIHEIDTKRVHKVAADKLNIHLKKGTNKLFIKLANHTGDWGFSLAIAK